MNQQHISLENSPAQLISMIKVKSHWFKSIELYHTLRELKSQAYVLDNQATQLAKGYLGKNGEVSLLPIP